MKELIGEILKNTKFATIATATKNGDPWISPVFFNYDDDFNIYWESSKITKHSVLIKENPKVAIVVFDSQNRGGENNGVYFEGRAQEVSKENLEKIIEIFYTGPHDQEHQRVKTPEDYLDEKPLRLYEFSPEKVYKLTNGKRINGYYLDERFEVDLDK